MSDESASDMRMMKAGASDINILRRFDLTMRERFDVVVVGGGVSGLFFSRKIGEKGFTVALIEMKSFNEIGEKVCGDAIDKVYFRKLGLREPRQDEVENIVKGIRIISPDEKHFLLVKGEGYELNRKKFGQRLLKEAMNSGVMVYDLTYAKKPLVENGMVKGVLARDVKRNRDVIFEGKIIVDASGVSAVLRSRLPSNWWVSEKLDPKDTSVAYREIRVLDEDVDEPGHLRIYLSTKIAPGGYWWFFPKGRNKVNVGLGVQGGVGNPNPVGLFNNYIISRSQFKNSKIIHSGGGVVPTRRPLETLVYSNFVAIGDAAYTVNPLHGGGIGSSLTAAWATSRVVAKALEEGNINTHGLWEANKLYIELYGAKQASLDLLRIFLQKLSDEELNYIIEKKVISDDELLEISLTGDLRISIANKILKAIRFLKKPSLLLKLKVLADYMQKMKQHYFSYPETPTVFLRWRHQLINIYEEFRFKLKR